MRLTYIASACLLVEHAGVRVLCDPWLTDGIYGGAWYHNPPLTVTPEDFHGVEYVYLSHIHPDHADFATLARLSRSTTIVLAQFDESLRKPLALRLMQMGFPVVELTATAPFLLGPDFAIEVIPADNCDPSVCGRFFGCTEKVAQIDSLAVFHGGGHTIVNVNDCPYALARDAVERVRGIYGSPDLLCVGYAGAGPWPQCYTGLSDEATRTAAAAKRDQFLAQMRAFCDHLEPRLFLPFAGQYTLGGSLVDLNGRRGVPELEDVPDDPRLLRLNRNGWIDLETGEQSAPWVPDDPEARRAYRETLRTRRLDHEADPWPDRYVLYDLIAQAERAWRRRSSTRHPWAVRLVATYSYDDPMRRRVSLIEGPDYAGTLTITLDARLLHRLLMRAAHWNNAEVGSLLQFARTPDVYDRALFHLLSYLHV